MSEPPLPGMPEPPPVFPGKPRSGFRAHRIKATNLCGVCTRLIHVFGVEVAPYPKPATWRVVTPDWSAYMCQFHKSEEMNARE